MLAAFFFAETKSTDEGVYFGLIVWEWQEPEVGEHIASVVKKPWRMCLFTSLPSFIHIQRQVIELCYPHLLGWIPSSIILSRVSHNDMLRILCDSKSHQINDTKQHGTWSSLTHWRGRTCLMRAQMDSRSHTAGEHTDNTKTRLPQERKGGAGSVVMQGNWSGGGALVAPYHDLIVLFHTFWDKSWDFSVSFPFSAWWDTKANSVTDNWRCGVLVITHSLK